MQNLGSVMSDGVRQRGGVCVAGLPGITSLTGRTVAVTSVGSVDTNPYVKVRIRVDQQVLCLIRRANTNEMGER